MNKQKVKRKGEGITSRWWLWLVPMFLLLGMIYLYPVLNVIRMSFTNIRIGKPTFNYSLDSYRSVFADKELWDSLRITLIFALGSVFFQLGIGLAVAMLINKDLRGAGLVKLSMTIAWVVPGVITGVVWQMLYSSASWGVFNNFIKALGGTTVSFLSIPWLALMSALIANIWRGTGFSGIMQYSAIKSIPPELFESARLDGASSRQVFAHITLPQLKPMLLINLVLISIYSINTYDSIYSLTRGGPGNSTTVLPLMTYKSVFTYLNLGRGSVYAIILLFVSVILTSIYIKLMNEKGEK
ncbi:MAG: sugar ABC transporter permease [Sphaerochaetaceae bacterium]|nr:sugar ABC transporter permease [Sphaerochaetaceae bacterium]